MGEAYDRGKSLMEAKSRLLGDTTGARAGFAKNTTFGGEDGDHEILKWELISEIETGF